VKTLIDITVPLITFVLLCMVGSSLDRGDFARVRRQPQIVLAGLAGPLFLLPPLAVGLISVFRPPPEVEAGLLLIATCPIGGISNIYSYLAGASTALSVTLTGLSSLLAVLTIPLLDRLFEAALGRSFGFTAPTGLLVVQLAAMLALSIVTGMWIRQRWPSAPDRYRASLQRLGFGALAVLLALVIVNEYERFLVGLSQTVPLALAFVAASMLAGWVVGSAIGAARGDQFTLAAEFATRNVAIAAAIAVTLLNRLEFAIFATTYFLTEVPLMLAAIAVFRARTGPPGEIMRGEQRRRRTQ
jgi:BASS family bile acid:Na+ symporter